MRNAGPYARLKFAMDYWCALWFWPIDKADLLPTRSEFLFDMSLILEGTIASVNVNAGQLSFFGTTEMEQLSMDIIDTYGTDTIVDIPRLRQENPRLDLAARIAEQNKFMHWELEFADLFAERGGFDLIIGNPPWVKVTWNEQAVLADEQPLFVIKNLNSAETTRRRDEVLAYEHQRAAYLGEFESISGIQSFLNAVQNYTALRGQQANLFKCFLPQAWYYGESQGVSAFVHPDSVYDDPKGVELRSILYHILAVDTNGGTCGADSIQHDLDDFIYPVKVIPPVLREDVDLKVVPDQFSVLLPFVHPIHPIKIDGLIIIWIVISLVGNYLISI